VPPESRILEIRLPSLDPNVNAPTLGRTFQFELSRDSTTFLLKHAYNPICLPSTPCVTRWLSIVFRVSDLRPCQTICATKDYEALAPAHSLRDVELCRGEAFHPISTHSKM